MKTTKIDGWIEIETSSCGCCPPPGHTKEKMHVNTTSMWCRTNGGEWQSVPRDVSSIDLYEYAKAADSVKEFEDLCSSLTK